MGFNFDIFTVNDHEEVVESLAQVLTGRIEKSTQQQIDTLAQAFGGDIVEPTLPLFDLAHLVLNSTWHARCVHVVSSVAVSQGWILEHEGDSDLEKEMKELNEIARGESEGTPGNYRGLETVLKNLAIDLRALGSAYLEIVRDAGGKIVEIYHVPALTVRKRKAPEGRVNGYWQMVGLTRDLANSAFNTQTLPRSVTQTFALFGGAGFQKTFFKEFGDEETYNLFGDIDRSLPIEESANELIQLKSYHPLSPFYGIPEWISAFSAMVADEAAEKWNMSFFENNRVPRWLFKIIGQMLSDEEKEDFRSYFLQMLKARAHKPMVVCISDPSGDIKSEKLEADVNEASFLDMRDKSRDEILAAHGVLPRIVGVITPGQLGGKGDARQQKEDFRDFTIAPIQGILEAPFNELLFPAFGWEGITLKLNSMSFEDAEEFEKKAKSVKDLMSTAIMSPNEAREKLGLKPIDEKWADKYYQVTKDGLVEVSNDALEENQASMKTMKEVNQDLRSTEKELEDALNVRPKGSRKNDESNRNEA